MSFGATLSVRTLYGWDNSLFDDMALPVSLDRDIAISNIIMECDGLELLYPDWGYMRQAIKWWSAAQLWGWQKLADSLSLEYDPIANYDRREEWSDTGNASERTASGETSTASTEDAASVKEAAFNGPDLVERQSTANKGSATSANEAEGSAERESANKHKGRVWGNIGVTTSQQLIMSERELARYSVYNEIAQDFKARFCLMVY